MDKSPWVTIVGLGEDGPAGLSPASHEALENAEIIMGPARHLALLPDLGDRAVEWPVPFRNGIPVLLSYRGRRVAVLASGDPFWFGAGSVIARHLAPDEWRALPNISTFSLAASRMGWPLETTICLGLHAAPLTRLRPHLAAGVRAIILLRNGASVVELADYLTVMGFGATRLVAMEALGGPREVITECRADDMPVQDFGRPVCAAIDIAGSGLALTKASGLADDLFESDGQITKRPMRALTLSALAPRPFEHLWDIGGGSGSIAIEWLLAHPTTTATSIDPRPDRADRIKTNATRLGVDHLQVIQGAAPDALAGLAAPDAVFIGGGLSEGLLDTLWAILPKGTRLVANAVTLDSEAILAQWQMQRGGDLMRIELAHAAPLGRKRGWKSAYPVVQWQVTL